MDRRLSYGDVISRETTVQAGAVIVGVGLLLVWSALDGRFGPASSEATVVDVLFGFGWTFVVLAGAHLYLARRGEDGMVPVDARWRFVIVVAASLGLFALAAVLTGAEPVAGVEPQLPVYATLATLLVGYFLYEAREGYLERRPA